MTFLLQNQFYGSFSMNGMLNLNRSHTYSGRKLVKLNYFWSENDSFFTMPLPDHASSIFSDIYYENEIL